MRSGGGDLIARLLLDEPDARLRPVGPAVPVSGGSCRADQARLAERLPGCAGRRAGVVGGGRQAVASDDAGFRPERSTVVLSAIATGCWRRATTRLGWPRPGRPGAATSAIPTDRGHVPRGGRRAPCGGRRPRKPPAPTATSSRWARCGDDQHRRRRCSPRGRAGPHVPPAVADAVVTGRPSGAGEAGRRGPGRPPGPRPPADADLRAHCHLAATRSPRRSAGSTRWSAPGRASRLRLGSGRRSANSSVV